MCRILNKPITAKFFLFLTPCLFHNFPTRNRSLNVDFLKRENIPIAMYPKAAVKTPLCLQLEEVPRNAGVDAAVVTMMATL